MKTEFIIIIFTCGSGKEANAISGYLLEEKLVACANIIGSVKSKFWWKGKIESAEETIVLLKTKRNKFKLVEHQIKRLHSYDVPEIISAPILQGNRDYLKWLDKAGQ